MDRLIANQTHSEMLRLDPTQPDSLVFHDPEDHEVELMVSDTPDTPLVAEADDIPAEHRILGLEGARSFTTLEEQLPVAEHLGFRRTATGSCWTASAAAAGTSARRPGRAKGDGRVGVWHHIAFDAGSRRRGAARPRRGRRGRDPWTRDLRPLLLRLVLLDVARRPDGDLHDGPGFQLDEKLEDLGDRLCLSPRVEPLRARLERELTPIVNPRPRSKRAKGAAPPSTNGVPSEPAPV